MIATRGSVEPSPYYVVDICLSRIVGNLRLGDIHTVPIHNPDGAPGFPALEFLASSVRIRPLVEI